MEGVQIETELVAFAGCEAFDDHIDRSRQPLDRLSIGGSLQVQDDAAFAGVQVQEHAAAFRIGHAVGERAQVPRGIAEGRLNFDDIRAKVAQQPRGIRPGDALRKVEHAQPGKQHVQAVSAGPAHLQRGSARPDARQVVASFGR